jgi:hypothetical protein
VVLLGALLAIRPVVAATTVRTILDEMVTEPAAKACNAAALERGAREVVAPALAV